MFQNVNIAKSTPFALLTIYQKILVSPQSFLKLPPFWQITRNSPTIFRFEQREMEPSNFTANCVKITQFANPPAINHAKSVQFLLNPTNPCSPSVPQAFLQQISQNPFNSLILRAIDAKLTNFALIPTNLLFYFSDSRKTGSSTLLARITRIPQPLIEIREIPLLSSLHNILTF